MEPVLKILHLEDMPSDAELVRLALKKSNLHFEILLVDNKETFTKALEEFSPDIILSDHSLPSFNSHEALNTFRETGRKIPFILITANISEEFAVDVIQRGADDYILKDRLKRLPVAINNALEKFRLEKERQSFLDKIIHNEKHYRALIDNMGDAIILVSAEGNLIYQSPSVKRLTGFLLEDMGNGLTLDHVHEEDKQACVAIFEEAHTKPGIPVPMQYRILHKQGYYIWIEGTITNLLHDESVRALVVNYRDVTARKIAEQQLKESEQFNKGVLASLGSHIAVINEAGEILAVNKAWDDFAVANCAAVLERASQGSNYFEVCKKSLAAGEQIAGLALEGIFSVFKKEKKIFELEYACHSPTQNRWFILHVMNFGNDDSKVVISHHNITEIKEAQEALRRSESNLQAIFENTSEGFILADRDGIIKSFNNKSRDTTLLNTERALTVGASIFDYSEGACREAYMVSVSKVFAGELLQYDHPFHRKDGETRWFNFIFNPVYTAGAIAGLSITSADITERKEAEHALSQSELRYRRIVETAHEGIWLLDKNNRTTFVNKRMCEILEYSAEEMLGKENFDFMDEKGKAAATDTILRRRNGIRENVDLRYITKSGKHIWADISASPVINSKGEYEGALAMVSDITDKKNLENLLDKTNNLARIGSWEINMLNNSLYWSAKTREIHEVEDDFVPDLETAINFYKPGSREAITIAMEQAIKEGIPLDLELEVLTAKGNECWIRTIGEAEMVNGRCTRVYGSFQDIDKRKRSELEVLKVFEEKNVILESIGDGFYAIDRDWVITYWNKEAEHLLSIKRDDILGKNIWDFFPDNVDKPYRNFFLDAMKKNKAQHFESYNARLDVWFEVSAYPSVNGLSVYFKNISKRKLSDIQLNTLNAELRKNAKELAVSNAELEQFAYVASHDLQEPLRMVTSFLTQVENKYGALIDDKGRQYIHFAVDGAVRMRRIILDLLEFSRVGRNEENTEEVALDEVIKNIIALYAKEIAETNAVISFDPLPVIKAYRSPLQQVFQNLIGNALKYHATEGVPLISIRSTETADAYEFSVQDNGIGIAPEYFEKIFVIFQRLHNKDDYSGTGMGLAICKKIVENMGGKIWIESTGENGSTFYFNMLKQV
jgi:PAS domain S-box-containing protein